MLACPSLPVSSTPELLWIETLQKLISATQNTNLIQILKWKNEKSKNSMVGATGKLPKISIKLLSLQKISVQKIYLIAFSKLHYLTIRK